MHSFKLMQFRIEKKRRRNYMLKKLEFKIVISRFELRLLVKQNYLKSIPSNSLNDMALDVPIHQC